QKSGTGASEIIENPILANFKEGLSILEYFISSHGARKGLADTALKTADAGYLTRRLVDVAHDVIITEEDCGTLRGLEVSELRKDDGELIESLYDRILGRISVHDVFHPQTNELIVASGEEITEDIAKTIADSPIEKVEIRSVLTCESHRGVCAKCYGRNLATHRMVQKGEAVGVIAAQSIGEPGTQLTLRTFHSGGIAGNIASESTITAKYDGILEIDELRTVSHEEEGGPVDIVVTRMAELKILDQGTKIALVNKSLPYGSRLYFKNGDVVKKGDKICEWDQYNIVIISEYTGKLVFEDVVEGVNFKQEIAPQTGFIERIITETKDKSKIPVAKIIDKNKEVLAVYNLPVGARLMKNEKDQILAGDILIKMPKVVGKGGDITGGLPRVTELFEARNPSNPAVVSEIDGVVQFGKIKRGNREIEITPKEGNSKKYLVPLSKQILVQPNDYIKAGTPLIDGAITPSDILAIKGPTAVQEYLVNEIQDVYRLQGVKINNKHFEVIVRQMMRKVVVEDPGDTQFLEKQVVDKWEFRQENDSIFDKKVVVDAGDSENFTAGQIVSYRRLRDENSMLKRKDKKLVEARGAIPATSSQVLQGITKAALQTSSFMSAASFQETTKVLNEAAIRAKEDTLEGMKENVIVGHLIPAGTGLREFQSLRVCNKAEVAPYLDTLEQQQPETEI
ncbi:MAG: DNA-directed RNA polymerase subunit beta', partial [Bacteroidales bacterium]|nr:DNA-directed RNA polymerase subunit beta' [Bacteroidales bacterium]